MLEAVGNTPITATIAKAQPVQQSATAPEVSGEQEIGQFAKSRIRVDNFLDRAILELRSKETGEVVQQYPTEQQIKAFDRASELQNRPTEGVASQSRASSEGGQETASSFSDTGSDLPQVADIASVTAGNANQVSSSAAETSVPQASAQTQLSVNVASGGTGSGSSTQSIIV